MKKICPTCLTKQHLLRPVGIWLTMLLTMVRDLVEASNMYGTLNNVLDVDVKNDTVRTQGSLSCNLRRVRQGLDLIRAIFENFLSSEYCSLKEAASEAYAQVCAPYHTWAVRTAVYAGMCALPTWEQLLLKLNENGEIVIPL
ncbi:ACD11 homolog protein-like isoform X4 [Camellia sinensis]|uniref:ACD11 homolog protein-like isoform X4 n=1 Tax=Camellia sinensis TaxID=4442 RepID=UPI001036BEFB|nr:ACD11 homolog protein-like isoform X4 [Camellia sinensis]